MSGPALVVGCGYLGLRVARRWVAAGREVFAVTRSAQRAAELAALGLRPILADVTRTASLAGLPAAQTVLYAVGRDPPTPASPYAIYVEGLTAVLDRLAALDPPPSCVLFVSSTGVYGDAACQWVDESSPCLASEGTAAVLIAAEAALQNHRLGPSSTVLRLAGLYGPGRLPKLADLLAGRPLPADPQAVLNLIHVEDAAEALLAAEVRGRRPGVYNIADGHPVLRGDFYRHLAELTGCRPPEFISSTAPTRRHRAGHKRVDNRRMLEELQVRLAYPTYREGLASIVAQLRHPGAEH